MECGDLRRALCRTGYQFNRYSSGLRHSRHQPMNTSVQYAEICMRHSVYCSPLSRVTMVARRVQAQCFLLLGSLGKCCFDVRRSTFVRSPGPFPETIRSNPFKKCSSLPLAQASDPHACTKTSVLLVSTSRLTTPKREESVDCEQEFWRLSCPYLRKLQEKHVSACSLFSYHASPVKRDAHCTVRAHGGVTGETSRNG